MSEIVQSVILDDANNSLIILDQTLLPGEKRFIELKTEKDVWDAIYELKVRGAPAIGITAAYAIYLSVKKYNVQSYEQLYEHFKKTKEYLASSRPTAVNLFWALNRMEERLKKESNNTIAVIKTALKEEADNIYKEDEKVCKSIGEYALSLLKPGFGLLTHCNPGTIATARYGTALAPIYLGNERGYDFKVFADETRPLLQGARLTTWELKQAGVDVTLICDNMASIVMKEGKVQAVLVGCDRVAANGDTANKIGTSSVAILAKYYNIPFYVCAPISTIDLDCKSGEDIKIEIRPEKEITTKWYTKPMVPEGVKAYNPAFDVTDEGLITAIITEKGIVYPPFSENLKKVLQRKSMLI
ncbi:S-methyl-5-thioribose-1-phosphate isomerase [Clostridium drakei]|uniref:Methylthioribose-1-phosphate isomerase n=1 Tax=Clostridium drakei TaxID=332101 RepID=A0A2U8DU25_9CLOT|nr:S-methyl-5-thioribose-1-phosphate isomerase [Clostridium drakei]AWI06158.1 S-methyl-5-thioribose-1-phosphate isomerase [Clostridium drakei]